MMSGGVLKETALDALLDMAMQNSPTFLCNDRFLGRPGTTQETTSAG